MVIKNLLPTYHSHLFANYFLSIKALIEVGPQIEDGIPSGEIKKEECKFRKVGNLEILNKY